MSMVSNQYSTAKIAHVQPVLPQKDVIALKERSGESLIKTNDPNHREKTQVCSTFKSRSELILDQIHTLPLHFKLVLYACIRLLSQDKNNGKVTLTEVYVEYRKLADELNITSPSISRIHELARELETLGFLKCTYPCKRDGRVGHVRIFEPAQMPGYASILKEELGMVLLEEDVRRM